jgi:predicted CoA-binding protein
MPSNYESFWQHGRYAVVGHKAKRNFPELTYKGLKKLGKTVFAVDPSLDEVQGDTVFKDLDALPEKVDGVVLETPPEETREWVAKAADLGIKDVWIHMQRDTPEALALAQEKGINVRHGTCAVMYVTPGFTYHALHRGIMKLVGKY